MESNQMINQMKDISKRLDKIEKIEKDLRDISDQLEAIKINMAPLSLMATTINVSLPILVSSYQCANGFIEQNALDKVVLAANEYARKMEQINSISEKE